MKKSLGDFGEKIAEGYLKKHGYTILEKNYRTRFGEVDIIAKEGEIICFVEVKTRTGTDFGLPQEAVNFKKQNKIIRAALAYITENKFKGTWRIDVVAILIDKNKKTHNIELIRNATSFSA